jgi:hypothetical protein
MSKYVKITLTIVLAIFFMVFISCEGPAGDDGTAGIAGTDGTDGGDGADGTDGANGADGVDGNVTCGACHSDADFEMKRQQFAMAKHTVGEWVAYAGGRASCAKCHSHEGFVAFAEGFDGQDIANPSPWECATCHGIHQAFEVEDYALRLSEPVDAIFDDTVTFLLKGNNAMDLVGGSNLCANCHQSRRSGPDATETTFTITSTHWGPHHGPQANTVYGAGFSEIVGTSAYPAAGSNFHLDASCVGCHMAPFDADEGEGGHSFIPSLAACNVCHATLDFDYGGLQTEVEEYLIELRDLLIVAGLVAGDDVDGYHPVPGTYPTAQAQAAFNWIGLDEDRSLGAHNPRYIVPLLKNSIAVF